ncbi:MAG: hypothetical protein D6732_25270 [Methanobacteriota archaeon]|nr:MAG: hypothetical protein D6732_25270 [Euryarchaeota archaeon]
MTLIDEVKSRINTQRLVELTNSGDATATTVNDTVLGKAVSDIQAEFELFASQNYDDSNPVHVAICVDGVMAKLYQYAGNVSPLAQESFDMFIARCERIKEGNIPGPSASPSTTDKKFPSSFFDDFRGSS